jgi:hypothetical protein
MHAGGIGQHAVGVEHDGLEAVQGQTRQGRLGHAGIVPPAAHREDPLLSGRRQGVRLRFGGDAFRTTGLPRSRYQERSCMAGVPPSMASMASKRSSRASSGLQLEQASRSGGRHTTSPTSGRRRVLGHDQGGRLQDGRPGRGMGLPSSYAFVNVCDFQRDPDTRPDASRRRDLRPYRTGALCPSLRGDRHDPLAGGETDDQSDQLRRQAPRTTVHDRQTAASIPAPTPSEECRPAASLHTGFPEILEGSGTGPVAGAPHL